MKRKINCIHVTRVWIIVNTWISITFIHSLCHLSSNKHLFFVIILCAFECVRVIVYWFIFFTFYFNCSEIFFLHLFSLFCILIDLYINLVHMNNNGMATINDSMNTNNRGREYMSSFVCVHCVTHEFIFLCRVSWIHYIKSNSFIINQKLQRKQSNVDVWLLSLYINNNNSKNT